MEIWRFDYIFWEGRLRRRAGPDRNGDSKHLSFSAKEGFPQGILNAVGGPMNSPKDGCLWVHHSERLFKDERAYWKLGKAPKIFISIYLIGGPQIGPGGAEMICDVNLKRLGDHSEADLRGLLEARETPKMELPECPIEPFSFPSPPPPSSFNQHLQGTSCSRH